MEEKKLVLIGGGGHCKSVLDAAIRTKQYSEIVITDPMIKEGTQILGCTVVGDDSRLQELKEQGFQYAFVTVGSILHADLRMKLAGIAERFGFVFPTIVDPSAVVSQFCKIGEGSFIGKNVVINADAFVGKHCILNSGCIIEHECAVNDFTHISVGTILCGNVKVGRESFIGAGATVIQGLTIGNRVVVGANSTVLVDVEDNRAVNRIVSKGRE